MINSVIMMIFSGCSVNLLRNYHSSFGVYNKRIGHYMFNGSVTGYQNHGLLLWLGSVNGRSEYLVLLWVLVSFGL